MGSFQLQQLLSHIQASLHKAKSMIEVNVHDLLQCLMHRRYIKMQCSGLASYSPQWIAFAACSLSLLSIVIACIACLSSSQKPLDDTATLCFFSFAVIATANNERDILTECYKLSTGEQRRC